MPAITVSLTAPPVTLSRASGEAFDADVLTWLAWHNTQQSEYSTFTTEINAAVVDINADAVSAAASAAAAAAGTTTSSSTSLLISVTTKSLTVGLNKNLPLGSFLIIASSANTANYMHARIDSYAAGSGALGVTVISIGGSGTFSDWVISTTSPGVVLVGSLTTFTASGSITAGDPVIVTHDGKAASVATVGAGSIVTIALTDNTDISSAYDSLNNVVVAAYSDIGNASFGTAVVQTVSNQTTITAGTPVVFESADVSNVGCAFDSLNNKVIIAYADNGNSSFGTAVVGTVSGTAISFGTPVVFESASVSGVSAAFDEFSGKVVISYGDEGNSGNGTAVVGTVSGTAISFGTPIVFDGDIIGTTSTVYDKINRKIVIAYADFGNSSFGTAVVGTVSGTAISFGTPVVFESASVSVYEKSMMYDERISKILITYRNNASSNKAYAIAAVVNGTGLAFGTTSLVSSTINIDYLSITRDVAYNSFVVCYKNPATNYGTFALGSINHTSITFAAQVAFNSNSTQFISSVYDELNSLTVITHWASSVLKSIGYKSININDSNFIGLSRENATDGVNVIVDLPKSINISQSGLLSGKTYYVSSTGTLQLAKTDIKAGKAISATEILIN